MQALNEADEFHKDFQDLLDLQFQAADNICSKFVEAKIQAAEALRQASAFYAEGALVWALNLKAKQKGDAIINNIEMEISDKSVDECLLHPVLYAAAKERLK